MHHSTDNLEGQKFSRLKVLRIGPKTKDGRITWYCECICGKIVNIRAKTLKNGQTRSCGCLAAEVGSKIKHGKSGSPIYFVWKNMLNRCLYKKYKQWDYYGGRGISVCKRWMKFENFYKDMGDPPQGLTLDRINNDGNYRPSNCRWATRAEQSKNTRRNIRLKFNGMEMTLSEWAEKTGIKYSRLLGRVNSGKWPINRALFE